MPSPISGSEPVAGLRLEEVPGAGPLYGPAAEVPGPAVALLHGAEGPGAGWSHRFAAILAAHGLRALPLAYGEGDVFGAGPIREVPLGPLAEALERLGAHPRVTRVGLFGWSRGAEAAALLATLPDAPAIAALALHAPPDIVHGAFDPAAMRGGGDWRRLDPWDPRAWAWPGAEARLAPGSPIEIERFGGPVFLSSGTADEVWDHAMTLRLAARLEAAGRPAELFLAEGQGHAYDFDREPELWARLAAFFGEHAA